MSKKITGAEYPLAKIFSSDFDYEILPRVASFVCRISIFSGKSLRIFANVLELHRAH